MVIYGEWHVLWSNYMVRLNEMYGFACTFLYDLYKLIH